MRRGDVYWANIAPRSGPEQTGKRPVVIVSHNGFNLNAHWQSMIVVPLTTSSSQAKRGPTAVEIPGGSAGLPKTCNAVCHQVTTLDRAKLTKRIGALSTSLLLQLDEGLRAAMDLEQ